MNSVSRPSDARRSRARIDAVGGLGVEYRAVTVPCPLKVAVLYEHVSAAATLLSVGLYIHPYLRVALFLLADRDPTAVLLQQLLKGPSVIPGAYVRAEFFENASGINRGMILNLLQRLTPPSLATEEDLTNMITPPPMAVISRVAVMDRAVLSPGLWYYEVTVEHPGDGSGIVVGVAEAPSGGQIFGDTVIIGSGDSGTATSGGTEVLGVGGRPVERYEIYTSAAAAAASASATHTGEQFGDWSDRAALFGLEVLRREPYMAHGAMTPSAPSEADALDDGAGITGSLVGRQPASLAECKSVVQKTIGCLVRVISVMDSERAGSTYGGPFGSLWNGNVPGFGGAFSSMSYPPGVGPNGPRGAAFEGGNAFGDGGVPLYDVIVQLSLNGETYGPPVMERVGVGVVPCIIRLSGVVTTQFSECSLRYMPAEATRVPPISLM